MGQDEEGDEARKKDTQDKLRHIVRFLPLGTKIITYYILKRPITLLQFPITLTLLNCFGINYEKSFTYAYTLDCF